MKSRMAFLALGLVLVSGCRFQGGESFTSATNPNPPFDARNSEWKGDPGAASTIADASGGTIPQTSYSRGAGAGNGEKTDAMVNRPTYGSGQGTNETGNSALPGHEQTNAPVFQGGPNTRG